ncbi:TolB family protein [Aphanothece hegewaldii]|nr:biopolymer transporter [Aphanothece hegewaldii]
MRVILSLMGLSSCSEANFITPPVQDLVGGLNTATTEQYANFSYDGHYLVFASDRQSQRTIYLYDFQQRRLLPLPGLNQSGVLQDQPAISADGRYIVYVSELTGKPDIFIYDRQTFQTENITKNILGEKRHPTISGNGRFVAFESNRFGQWNIEVYDRGANIPLSLPQGQPLALPKKEQK